MKLTTRRQSESGFILISAVFVALFLTLLLGAAFMRSQMQIREAAMRRYAQEAFYAAESGVDRALFELRQNPNWTPGAGGFAAVVDEPLETIPGDATTTIGFYSINVGNGGFLAPLGDTRWVRSIGRDIDNNLTRVILARVLIDDPSRFIMSTPGVLRFKSGSQLDADVLGNELFFDVNTTLPAAQRAIDVNGDVLYINNVNPSDPMADPDINISGNVTQYPSITFPGVDLSRYSSLATSNSPLNGYYSASDLTVDLENLSTLNNDPLFDPLIIYADGDIRITGEFSDSVVVVASGNIYIEGDIEPDPAHGLAQPPQIGLFAKQDVIIEDGVVPAGGDLNLEAFVIADGGGSSNGEFNAESTVGLGNFNFTGSISVRGEGGGTTGIDLSIFATRSYTHNPNLSVPFSPYIANIISWQESTVADVFPPVAN